jgi:hypothetical protein
MALEDVLAMQERHPGISAAEAVRKIGPVSRRVLIEHGYLERFGVEL